MRPKFRAWDKEFKEMVQVDALVLDAQVIKATYKNGNVVKEDIKYYDLMQTTGLLDKNGKEIFEGDIVDYKGRKAIVNWHGSYASFIYRFVDELQEKTKIRVMKPQGTYLLWLDFSAYPYSDDELHAKFHDQAKLILNRGTDFGKEGNLHARLNVAAPFTLIEEITKRLVETFHK